LFYKLLIISFLCDNEFEAGCFRYKPNELLSIFLVILATLPGLAICFLIYKLDKYEQEPLWALLYSFVLGALATIPAISIQLWAGSYEHFNSKIAAITFVSSFGVVAASEEIAKCAVLLFGIYPRRFFNEPFDGIVYAVLVAMGFATVENILYAYKFGINTTLVRAFTAVPAHFVFAIVQGYFIGLAKYNPVRRMVLILQGLGLAILMHGIYDFLILQELAAWLSVLGSVSVYVCLYFCGDLVRKHLESSPFKPSL
jgi:RsiW-degrading membrane proteinase PrsW (M82 family)